jgi:hypothetical protein
MGWDDDDAETSEERAARIEEINAAVEALDAPGCEPDPRLEGIDWMRTDNGDLAHPLQHRCFESAIWFHHKIDELRLGEESYRDLEQFTFEFEMTGVKLGGALDGIARGGPHPKPSFTVACLKRALGHLHKAQAGLEALAPKRLLPEALVEEARTELFEIREGILQLMDRYRGRP